MKILILSFSFLFYALNTFAQEWDDPITISNWDFIWKSSFVQGNNASNAPEPSGWFWGVNMNHSSNSPTYKYNGQIALKNDNDLPTMYYRSTNQYGRGVWAKVIGSYYNTAIAGNLASTNSIRIFGNNLDGDNLSFMQNSGSLLVGWNRSAEHGETDFISNRGAGSLGGFEFRDISNSGIESLLMKITGNGGVGIGLSNPGPYRLATRSEGTGDRSGIYGEANSTSGGTSWGIVGKAEGSGDLAGIYGWAQTGGGKYAGYFNGSLVYTGSFNKASDERLKENIEDLSDGLEKILKLSPKRYDLKKIDGFNFAHNKEVGLLAQDVHQVIPEIVIEKILVSLDSTNRDDSNYLGIDYVALIPYLISAIQKQQLLIENQSKLIDSILQSSESKIDEASTPSIESIIPNPGCSKIKLNIKSFQPGLIAQILKSNGHLVKSIQIYKVDTSINVEDFDSGIYYVILRHLDTTFDMKRIIINK